MQTELNLVQGQQIPNAIHLSKNCIAVLTNSVCKNVVRAQNERKNEMSLLCTKSHTFQRVKTIDLTFPS